MKVISTRTEEIKFGRMIKGNQSEELCSLNMEVLTIETEGFKPEVQFAAAEYPCTIIRDVVIVENRYFAVSVSEGGKKKWLSVTLPPGLDPRPKPREWDVMVSKCSVSKIQYIYDPRCANASNPERIRVREIIEP
jgi:hypothetical protein